MGLFGFGRKETPKERIESLFAKGQRDFEHLDLAVADLSGLTLDGFKFKQCNLQGASLRDARLSQCVLYSCDFQNAVFDGAKITSSFLDCSDFNHASFKGSNFHSVDFSNAFLGMTDFTGATLIGVNFRDATLFHGNFSQTLIPFCEFDGFVFPRGIGSDDSPADRIENIVDFATVDQTARFYSRRQEMLKESPNLGRLYGSIDGMRQFFATVGEHGPSFLQIVEGGFAQGREPVRVFISYADEDRRFVDTLQKKLERRGCTAWFAPRQMEAGKTVEEQLTGALDQANAVIVVLSKHSMGSEWVAREVRYAGQAKSSPAPSPFFPVRLVAYEEIENWRVLDAAGRDLASDLRAFFIPDFSNWEEPDLYNRSGSQGFEQALDDLVADIKGKLSSSTR